jgi:hypothetical protein
MSQTVREAHDSANGGLDAYLDGLLGAADRDDFERRLEREPDLRAQVKYQQLIDHALRQCYAPPQPDRVLAEIDAARTTIRTGMRDRACVPTYFGMPRRLAVAAMLALGAVAVWRVWSFSRPAPSAKYPQRARKPMHITYRDMIENGFKPDWVCKTDEEFATAFRRRLGQPLLLAGLPDGISTVGLSYPNTITHRTIALLGKVRDHEVLVFVDRVRYDKGQSVPATSGLNLYRRQIGALVLYELSRLPEPHLLDLFYTP